jgi:hypothetical protein
MSDKSDDASERSQTASGVGTVEPMPSEDAAAVAEDMARLRAYLEHGDVNSAREFVKELEQRWPDSDRVRRFARLLAPPVVRTIPGTPSRSFRDEHNWLREHAHNYPGCWLAVLEDRLVAADPHLRTVLDTVRQTPGAETALIHFQPGPES